MTDPGALASFLRSRRERLQPADVGLPPAQRRRTPGLRREEVAALAGVSIDYLVRLEQGRDSRPSASVLTALAEALRLSEDERHHLFKLGAVASAPELCPTMRPSRAVGPTIQAILDRLDPSPAFVVNPFLDVVGCNDAWERLVRPLGMLDDDEPNLARFTFTSSRAPQVLGDWAASADEHAATLRQASLPFADDAGLQALLAELQGLPEFARRWDAHDVIHRARGTTRLHHPVVGELRLTFEALGLAEGAGSLLTWFPADEATEHALRDALGGARLRAV